MNEARLRENRKALIEYGQAEDTALPKKLTLALPAKTEMIKKALDQLSIGFGDKLYPSAV